MVVNLSKRSFQVLCPALESSSGAPKYLEWREPSERSRILIIFLLIISGILKKNTYDFPSFTSRSLSLLNTSMISFKPLASLTVAWPINIVSSMNFWRV